MTPPSPPAAPGIAVVAVGGNSLIPDPARQGIEHQWAAAQQTAAHLTDMIEAGWTVVITHGNGPQAGFNLRRSELAAHELFQMPLDLIVAETQGSIGYMLQQSLNNEFARRSLYRRAFTVVTQVLVDGDDPAFQRPTKPVGSFMGEAEARAMSAEGWQVVEDSGRGWRRVVASPEPRAIIELDAIRAAVQAGWIVIAGGGGGVPVVESEGMLRGVPAVIDKDRLSALLAIALGAELFVISTAVERVALNYGKADERPLDCLTVAEARRYHAEGHFPDGSMGPKIESIIRYLDACGGRALVTDPDHLGAALRGEAGTEVVH